MIHYPARGANPEPLLSLCGKYHRRGHVAARTEAVTCPACLTEKRGIVAAAHTVNMERLNKRIAEVSGARR